MTKADANNSSVRSTPDATQQFVAKVGERVRNARQKKGISRRILSENSGVSQRYLAQLETGKGNVSIALLYQIAEALGYTPGWFLGEKNPWNSDIHRLVEYYKLASPDQKERAFQVLEPSFGAANKGTPNMFDRLKGSGQIHFGKNPC